MRMKYKIVFYTSISTAFICFLLLIWMSRPIERDVKDNLGGAEHYIAHACGVIDGITYTNSKEALLQSLELGYKYVEVDLYQTTDGDVVCLYKLDDYNKMTGRNLTGLDTNTFINSKLYGKYTPMTLNDVIAIWEEKPFYIVTDKICSAAILNKYFKKHRDRVIVEALSTDDYKELQKDGYVPMLSVMGNIVSLKRFLIATVTSGATVSMMTMCYMDNDWLMRFYKRLGAKIVVWTVNDLEFVSEHIGREVDMVYTDSIIPFSY